jgi:putative endonuclease
MEKISYVYLMNSASRRALYTGVTGLLYKRVWEHKNNLGRYFTTKYQCYRLVYFEEFGNIEAAIAREKEIKGGRRSKKNRLVESLNPEWKDLAAEWYPQEFLRWCADKIQLIGTRSLKATRPLMKTRARSRLSG